MARIRTIKPDFFKDEVIAEMKAPSRLLYIGLWILADREGRMADKPNRIKIEIFPYEKINVDAILNELHEREFISRYEKNGIKIIQIKSFHRHQIPGRDEPQSEFMAEDGTVNEYIKPPNETIRNRIYQRDNYLCQYCQDNLFSKKRSRCLDHVIPYSRGGTNHESNLVTACKRCNEKKGAKTPDEAGMKLLNDPLNGVLTDVKNTVNGFVAGREEEGNKEEEGNRKEPPKLISEFKISDCNFKKGTIDFEVMESSAKLFEGFKKAFPLNKDLDLIELRDWVPYVRVLIAEKKYTYEQVAEVLNWAMEEKFWKKIITNVEKLEKNFETIKIQYQNV